MTHIEITQDTISGHGWSYRTPDAEWTWIETDSDDDAHDVAIAAQIALDSDAPVYLVAEDGTVLETVISAPEVAQAMPNTPKFQDGGSAIAARMTPEARTERARTAAQARHAANKPEDAAQTLTLGSTIIVQKTGDQWQAMLSRQRLYAFAATRNEAVAAVIQRGREHAADQWQANLRYVDLPKS